MAPRFLKLATATVALWSAAGCGAAGAQGGDSADPGEGGNLGGCLLLPEGLYEVGFLRGLESEGTCAEMFEHNSRDWLSSIRVGSGGLFEVADERSCDVDFAPASESRDCEISHECIEVDGHEDVTFARRLSIGSRFMDGASGTFSITMTDNETNEIEWTCEYAASLRP